ncbi:MAG: hypothetical protein V2B18_24775 [Pseudomonadota bacterium]
MNTERTKRARRIAGRYSSIASSFFYSLTLMAIIWKAYGLILVQLVKFKLASLTIGITFAVAAVATIVAGALSFKYFLGSSHDLRQEYRRILFGWAVFVFGSLICFIIVVENLMSKHPSFTGSQPFSKPWILRYFLYGMALVDMPVLWATKRSIRRRNAADDIVDSFLQLRSWVMLKGAFCVMPAVYGLVLFLANAFYVDFYVLSGYAVLSAIILYPKYSECEEWIRKASV